MNKSKNILLASTLSLLGLTLVSCNKEETRNQVVPYDTIDSTVVAEANGITVTEKELYDSLKYNYGVQVFNRKLDTLLYGDQINDVKYEGKVKIEIDETIAKAVYGTTELPKLKLMSSEDASLARKKFVDKMSREGLILEENELVFDPITKQTENVSFSNLSEKTINYYKLSQAKKLRGKEYINSVYKDEYITKDNKQIKNKYYISDKKIEARYESNYRKYNEATGIILRFTNARDAYEAIEEVTNGSNQLNKANLEEQYVNLFNNYYNYEEKQLTSAEIGVNENTIFKTNNEVAQLQEFHSDVNKYFLDVLEDGQGLEKPINIGDKYYLIFRKGVTFKTGGSKDIPYSKLTSEQKESINKELIQDIIDDESSSVSSTIYTEDLEKHELKIYDPFIENNFAGANSFYEYVTESNNKYIFNSKDAKFSYTTEQFYQDLLNYDVDSAVVKIILNKYLYKEHKSTYLTSEEEKKIKDDLNTEIKEFKKGNKNLNKAYGEANYLFFQYGTSSMDEVIMTKSAQAIKSDYIVDFINKEWAKDNKFDESKATVLNNIKESALAVLKEKKLFDINLDHILISVDNNQDGQPDNMLEFMDTLSASEKAEFESAISDLSHAIAREVAAISRSNTKEKLDYVVKAFNNNYKTCDGKNWSDYKKYHFTLKAEELGNIDETSVNGFVKEFKDYVEMLFDKAVRDNLDIPYDKEKDGRLYFTDRLDKDGNVTTKVTTENFETQDLCLTQFGYHMISLNSYKKDSTKLNFVFTKEQDTANDYGNIKLILDEKDKDNKNDDIYIITDIYTPSDSKLPSDEPSLNQVLVYFVEKTNGDVTSIKTSIKNNLSTLLDEVIAKFKSSGFQEYLLLKEVGKITSTNLEQFNYDRYLEYVKNSNENYDKESYYYNNWYNDKFNWTK